MAGRHQRPRWARWMVQESYQGQDRPLSWHLTRWGAASRLHRWEHWAAQFAPSVMRYFHWSARRI